MNIYKRILDFYGMDNQIIKAIEEMSELTKELCKTTIYPGDKVGEIMEEIADVEIMLSQLKIMFDCHEEVEEWKIKKLDRVRGEMDAAMRWRK